MTRSVNINAYRVTIGVRFERKCIIIVLRKVEEVSDNGLSLIFRSSAILDVICGFCDSKRDIDHHCAPRMCSVQRLTVINEHLVDKLAKENTYYVT